jgi:hypothetical protein
MLGLSFNCKIISHRINNNNNVQSVTFFSPVKGPYFLANDYSMSIDIPSYYDTHPDYIARIGWSDNPLKNNNNSWNMTIEELSSSFIQSRIITMISRGKDMLYSSLI